MNVHDASAALDVLVDRKRRGELSGERFREALDILRTILIGENDLKCRKWVLPVIEQCIRGGREQEAQDNIRRSELQALVRIFPGAHRS